MNLLIVDECGDAAGSMAPGFPRPSLPLDDAWRITRVSSFLEITHVFAVASPPPDIVLAYQERPKQLTEAMVLQCLRVCPLVRFISVLGPWCDGHLRTPGRAPGVLSLGFREADLHLHGMLTAMKRGAGPLALPLTSQELEEQRFLLRPPAAEPELRLRAAFDSSLAGGIAKGIEAELTTLGHQIVRHGNMIGGQTEDVDVWMVDADAECTPASRQDGKPRLSLHGFVRDGERGIAKTHAIADLATSLCRAIDAEPCRSLPTSQ